MDFPSELTTSAGEDGSQAVRDKRILPLPKARISAVGLCLGGERSKFLCDMGVQGHVFWHCPVRRTWPKGFQATSTWQAGPITLPQCCPPGSKVEKPAETRLGDGSFPGDIIDVDTVGPVSRLFFPRALSTSLRDNLALASRSCGIECQV